MNFLESDAATLRAASTLNASIRQCIPSLTFSLQTLLQRHEAYIAQSSKEKDQMMAQISLLQLQKSALDTDNCRYIAENRQLLNTLASLNEHSDEIEARNGSLSATLQSTQAELGRLSSLAVRTKDLETQLLLYEQEQLDLRTRVTFSEEQESRAVQRWHAAERSLGDVQDQIEQIEAEARRSQEPYVVISGEAVLEPAPQSVVADPQPNDGHQPNRSPGILSSSRSALGSRPYDADGKVVTSFVRDILEDNSQLQSGLLKMQDLLRQSSEEIHRLRKEIGFLSDDGEGPRRRQESLATQELSDSHVLPTQRMQEVHVHHHYHTEPRVESRTKDTQLARRRKRASLPSGTLSDADTQNLSESETSNNRQAVRSDRLATFPGTAHQASSQGRDRWSLQSGQSRMIPTGPSSPHSVGYDRCSTINDSTRPTSPESEYTISPQVKPQHIGRRTYSGAANKIANHYQPYDSILEELDNAADVVDGDVGALSRPIRRSASHESILSISPLEEMSGRRPRPSINKKGSTIFPLQTIPLTSRATTLTSPSHFTATPSRPIHYSSQKRTDLNRHLSSLQTQSKAKASSTTQTKGILSGNALRRAGLWMPWTKPQPTSASHIESPSQTTSSRKRDYTHSVETSVVEPSQPHSITIPANSTSSVHSKASNKADITMESLDAMKLAMGGRIPGVNQKGPIPGFLRPMPSTTSSFRDRMIAKTDKNITVDVDGLMDALS